MLLLFSKLANAQNLSNYWSKIVSLLDRQIHSTEILIKICTILLILFALFFIGFFITLMLARSKHRNEDSYEKDIKEKYELLLTGIIFNDEDEIQTEEWIASKKRVIEHFKKRYLSKRINKKYLRDHIVLLHKNFAGSAADVLSNLYIDLKLDKEAIRELNSPDWGTQANAIKELAQLKIGDAKKKIKNRTFHENQILRLEAQVAIIAMENDDPFSFLSKDKNHLKEWHQINLSKIIDTIDREKLPQFSKWFDSKNESIVEFCIKMTLQYDQFESIPELIELLNHKSQTIVGDAARTLGEFSATEAQTMMMKVFRNANISTKRKILTALGKCGTHELIPFLQQQLLQNEISIALEAGNALKLLGEDGINVLREQSNSKLYGVGDICKHLLDERI
jgi:HEAT repeat protein